ncbi:MAG: 2-octaprenyl-6-methoxyphenyl hydroxylase [Shewanella sp.]|nr:2-octaprenyl-6-methoxyphenyl hydroxylase [Shewanella sp.]MCF1429891.1 2-octaprenyl-6-methoxyphenyl hydroxylase [Shewanella sp.]MCF1437694.1 2-octaprenyl-6-methoxyphenyl hydroxylase [Shewanella sp.]MCF1457786.1 2-octaprenyl-6-methoxyphenyl hydroxylase [Shewanella sp.]
MSSEFVTPHYDVVIVGGAMAGATLAMGLSALKKPDGQALKIALVEAFAVDDAHPGYDARAIALSHGSIHQLSRLGLWPSLSHLGTGINSIHVSDRGHFGMTRLDAQDFHVPTFGQVVELARIGWVLDSAVKRADISYYCPDALQSLQGHDDFHELTLASGTCLRASLLVAADGAHSAVRQAFKLPLEQADFGQSAVIANIAVTEGKPGMAWERFTDTGPLALLPMSPVDGLQRLSVVWALSHEQACAVMALDDSKFLSQLQQAFGYRAGRFGQTGTRHSYPLTLGVMPRPAFHRCVFIGNAAQTLHPIAGQGFNLGLRDVVDLLGCIQTQLTMGEDLGSAALVHRYLRAREEDRRTTVRNIEFLVRGFSNDYLPFVLGRNLGLRLLSWIPPLQVPLAQVAMGWRAHRV